MTNNTTNQFAKSLSDIAKLRKTENGANSYSVSNIDHPLVRALYAIGSARGNPDGISQVVDAFREGFGDPNVKQYCTKFALMVRDIDQGAGERLIGRLLLTEAIKRGADPVAIVNALVNDRFGRWDDVIAIMEALDPVNDRDSRYQMFKMIAQQLKSDIDAADNVSLLGKWMPSINASNSKTRALARKFARAFNLNCAQYRKMLSQLREKIAIVERLISNDQWDQINYSHVPSQAMNRYARAFNNHDGVRYRQYLADVRNNKAKINTTTLSCYQIAAKFNMEGSTSNDVCNAMWSNLKFADFDRPIVPVCDVSGSMYWLSNPCPVDVSIGLSMYVAQSNKGVFHNKIITFSESPTVIELDDNADFATNYDKITHEGSGLNTNIERVFDLILSIAIKNNLTQDQLPTIAIFSDMEFDQASSHCNSWHHQIIQPTETLFETIERKYREVGLTIPKMVFWNIANRSNTVPLTENRRGLILVSGFSQNLVDMVISDHYDPWAALKEKLDSDRYSVV